MLHERKALEWLARNEKGLTNYFDGMYGANCDEIRELREMVHAFKEFKNHKDKAEFFDRHVFLVSFETVNKLDVRVVKNYIMRALKHFRKHDDQQAFDGTEAPRFFLKEIPLGPEEQHALVATVAQIKYAREFLNPFYQSVDKC